MRMAADADYLAATGNLNFQQAMAGAANAEALGNYQRGMRSAGIDEEYSSGKYGIGKAGVDVTGQTLNRQPGFLGDVRRMDQWMNIGQIAQTDIESRANERQFGLINAARGDLGGNLAREKARLTDVEAGITQGEQTAKRQEKQAQYKMFSDAAASGNVTQIARMGGKELKDSLSDNLANFQRERQQATRDRQQADQDYQTRMRELQEQEASATDARERLKIQRTMQELNESMQQRKYQEELAQVEDRKKQNFLELMSLEVNRRKEVGDIGVSRQKAEGDRILAFYQSLADQQRIQQERLAAETSKFGAYQMYPTAPPPRTPAWLQPPSANPRRR
jgi:hypothetical protein